MLKAYIRDVRQRWTHLAGNAFSRHTPSPRWMERAFADFIALDGDRQAMLAAIASRVRVAAAQVEPWVEGREDGRALVRAMLEGCTALDNGRVGHRALKLRSYVDVSLQLMALRIFTEYLADLASETMPVSPLELTALCLEHDPDSRLALLAHARLLLEADEVDAALESIQRALRVQAVCTTAQQMLFQAYERMRARGSTAPELEVLDYDLSDKFCHLPFTHFSTGFQGSTFPCACPAWVPFSIGNILEAQSAGEVWNSEAAMEIRRSILDGDYSYCSRLRCSMINTQKLPRKSEIQNPQWRRYIEGRVTRIEEMPLMVELNHDPTCNLACPSCRTEIVAAKAEEADQYARATERVILPLLRRVRGHTYITGGGEAFASQHFRSILRALNREEYPGLQVYLITNGQVLTPHRWSEFPNLPSMLCMLSVSVDAARAETYEKLRRPGKWGPLMRNLEFVAEMRRTKRIPLFGMNFVVQKANFREILEFVELGKHFGADQIWLQRVTNYGAYDQATFAEVDVTDPAHADHAELLTILRSPALQGPNINKHMLMSIVPEYVQSDGTLSFLL